MVEYEQSEIKDPELFAAAIDAVLENLVVGEMSVTLYETDPTEWMDETLCAEFID